MKVIIPLAGKGTRLRPHTLVTPKPMLPIAGKPVIDYVMDDLQRLGGVNQVVYITGHLKEKVEAYARGKYPFDSVFVEQKVQDGTAGAVALARPYVDQPVLIVFVDTIFDVDFSIIESTDADGIIWTREVEDYQRFGVVVTNADGHMTKIVEKPSTPVSKRANIGLYYIRNWKLLYEGIEHVLAGAANRGEFYLTDAFQYMIDHGAKIRVVDVDGWYDAGKLETLLETNRAMLETRHMARHPQVGSDVVFIEPVYVEDGVTLRSATIGPNVSIRAGSTVERSTLRDTVVGTNTRLVACTLHDSLIGDHVVLESFSGSTTLGDYSEVRGE